MTVVQRQALRVSTVGATVHLCYALQETGEVWKNGTEMKKEKKNPSNPFLPLDQLRRQILVELLLLHMRGFNLHAVLQHVDVVGLSVNCRGEG